MLEKLKKIFVDFTGNEDVEISNETDLKNDLGLNSFDLAQLACALEDELDIEIPDASIKNFRTVGDVINYIKPNNTK